MWVSGLSHLALGLPVRASVWLCMCLFVCLNVCPLICRFACQFVCLSGCPFVGPSFFASISVSFSVCGCVSASPRLLQSFYDWLPSLVFYLSASPPSCFPASLFRCASASPLLCHRCFSALLCVGLSASHHLGFFLHACPFACPICLYVRLFVGGRACRYVGCVCVVVCQRGCVAVVSLSPCLCVCVDVLMCCSFRFSVSMYLCFSVPLFA